MQGPKAKVVKTFKFTLPEGRSIGENIPLVDKGPFEGDYGKATRSRERPAPRAQTLGLPRDKRTLEGFLFPATYEMIAGASAGDLVKRQLDAYEENVAKVPMKTAKKRNLTRYDVLIIASMVEREAQLARERPLIAAVIHNRLARGHPARDRRHHPLPDQQLGAAAARLRARARHALQHAHAPRPAADADRQPGPRLDPRRREPRRRRSTCSSCASRASPASTRSRRPTPSSSATWRATRPPAAVLDDLPRRLRVAGGPLALARDAERGAAGRRARATGSTSRCRCRRSCSPRPCARCPPRASAAST